MMMQVHPVFKINRVEKGYTQIWPGGDAILDLRTVDESLPLPGAYPSTPCVAYSATRLSANQLLLVVGSRWSRYRDEYNRPGLSLWHGLLCVMPQVDQQLPSLANLLIGLVQRYEDDYEEIGRLVADVAANKQTVDWVEKIARLHPASYRLSPEALEKLRILRLKQDQIPNRANLRVYEPRDKQLAISCLLSLLLYRNDVRRVAGGMLTRSELDRFQVISLPANVPGYQEINLSKFFIARKPVKAQPRAKSFNRRGLLVAAAVILAGCVIGIPIGSLIIKEYLIGEDLAVQAKNLRPGSKTFNLSLTNNTQDRKFKVTLTPPPAFTITDNSKQEYQIDVVGTGINLGEFPSPLLPEAPQLSLHPIIIKLEIEVLPGEALEKKIKLISPIAADASEITFALNEVTSIRNENETEKETELPTIEWTESLSK